MLSIVGAAVLRKKLSKNKQQFNWLKRIEQDISQNKIKMYDIPFYDTTSVGDRYEILCLIAHDNNMDVGIEQSAEDLATVEKIIQKYKLKCKPYQLTNLAMNPAESYGQGSVIVVAINTTSDSTKADGYPGAKFIGFKGGEDEASEGNQTGTEKAAEARWAKEH